MNAIGGYFELEINQAEEYHEKLIKLNTARNAFEYILEAKKIKKVYIPYYTCYVMLEPLKKLNIEYKFYYIDKNLHPIIKFQIKDNEAILVNNYFGLTGKKNKNIKSIKNVILDNTQAYFETPIENIDTIYSCRKFFGVPDGAYLSTNVLLKRALEKDLSFERYKYIIKRFELNPEEAYNLFQENEKTLCGQIIKKMSKSTENFLKSFDYKKIKKVRETNYNFLHEQLKKYNELEIDLSEVEGPMVYPFFYKRKDIKEHLIKNKIYVATYWKEVLSNVKEKSIESELVKYLIPLPVDQRYNIDDMKRIIKIIMEEIK